MGTIEGLHAQAKPPVYMIAIGEVTNPDGDKNEYPLPAQASLKAHSAVYIAAGTGTVIDGSLLKGRTVIIRWDSMERLPSWRHSAEYESARKIGEKYAEYNLVADDGVK